MTLTKHQPECMVQPGNGYQVCTCNPHTHYIAMSGSHGCLPDSCNAYETYQDAVDALVAQFELGRTRKARLFIYKSLALRYQDGAGYCEIVSCHCDKPWEHCDAGNDPRDWEGYGRQVKP